MTNLEKVKAAVIAVVPDVMKLQLNCKVELIEDSHRFIETIHRARSSQNNKIVPYEILFLSGKKIVPTSFADFTYDHIRIYRWGILGRDIQLADVLLTIEDFYVEFHQYGELLTMGHYENPQKRTGHYDYCHWELSKPLHLQKPEVWEFLASLLPNEV